VRFQVLKAAGMKISVCWDVAQCALVEVDRRFRDVYRSHTSSLMMDAVGTYETTARFYQSATLLHPSEITALLIEADVRRSAFVQPTPLACFYEFFLFRTPHTGI
jgi:hypothetical protein